MTAPVLSGREQAVRERAEYATLPDHRGHRNEEAARLGHDVLGLLARVTELTAALQEIEVDARWIVGQFQRVPDEPIETVAFSIVDKCVAALLAGRADTEEGGR